MLQSFKQSLFCLSWHAGLQEYTRYYAAIAASNEYGRGVLSNQTEFRTLEGRKLFISADISDSNKTTSMLI